MSERISEVLRPRFAPLTAFFGVGVAVFLLTFITAVIITFILPESFASAARIRMGSRNDNPSTPSQQQSQPVYDPYFIQTELEVIQSEAILGRVVALLNLNANWSKRYAGGAPLKSSEAVEILKGRLELQPVRNTTLVEIRAFSENPQEAAKIANAVAEAYRDYRHEEHRRLTLGTIRVLEEQFEEQERKVRKAQDNVDTLRRELNIFESDAASPSSSTETETARRLQGELVSFESLLTKEENQLKQFAKLNPDQRRGALQAAIGPDNEFNGLLRDLDTAEQKLIALKNIYVPEHPEHQTAKALADDSSKRLNDRMDGIMIGLSNRVAGLQATVSQLRERLDETRQSDITKFERSRPFYEAKQGLEELVRFRTILNMKRASEIADVSLPKYSMVQIIDRAVPGLQPVRPRKAFNLAVGAFGGMFLALLVGGGAALIASLFQKRMRGRTATT